MSNQVTLPDFVIESTPYGLCDHPDFALNTTVPVSECEVLVDLYITTNGDTWTNKTNWLMTTNVEDWFGIRTTTAASQPHIDGIFLHKSSGGDIQ